MALLIGNREPGIGLVSENFNGSEFEALLDDFGDDHFGVRLVGMRRIPVRAYRKAFGLAEVIIDEAITPLELSLIIYDDNKVQDRLIAPPLMYLETHPYGARAAVFEQTQAAFNKHNQTHYGVIAQQETPREELGRGRTVKRPALLPSASSKPFYRAFAKKPEIIRLINDVGSFKSRYENRAQASEYLTRARNLNEFVRGLFDNEELTTYRPIRPAYVASEHTALPVFSLDEYLGRKEEELIFKPMLEKLAIFALGTNRKMRESLTNRAQNNFHLAESVIPLSSFGMAMPAFESIRIGDYSSPYIYLFSLAMAFGADSLFRVYKTETGKRNYRSGFIGSLREQINELQESNEHKS